MPHCLFVCFSLPFLPSAPDSTPTFLCTLHSLHSKVASIPQTGYIIQPFLHFLSFFSHFLFLVHFTAPLTSFAFLLSSLPFYTLQNTNTYNTYPFQHNGTFSLSPHPCSASPSPNSPDTDEQPGLSPVRTLCPLQQLSGRTNLNFAHLCRRQLEQPDRPRIQDLPL